MSCGWRADNACSHLGYCLDAVPLGWAERGIYAWYSLCLRVLSTYSSHWCQHGSKKLDPVVLISCTKEFQGKISSQSPKTTFREHLCPFPLSYVLDLVSQCIKSHSSYFPLPGRLDASMQFDSNLLANSSRCTEQTQLSSKYEIQSSRWGRLCMDFSLPKECLYPVPRLKRAPAPPSPDMA